MKTTRIFLVLLALFSSSSCIKKDWRKNPHVEVRNLFKRYSEQAKRKQGIWLTRYGFEWSGKDNVYDGKVHVIDIGYSLDKNMKYEDAKKYFFTFFDELIDYVNQHEEFKDLFYHFPIGYKDFFLSFSFDYNLKGHLEKDDVYLISIFHNKVHYTVVDDFDESNDINPYITRFTIEELPIKNKSTPISLKDEPFFF
jgi:hypothetical protein